MRTVTIAILLFCGNCLSAQPYTAKWTGTGSNFEMQRSSDKKTWKTVTTIKNGNTIDGTGATYYWRIKLTTPSGIMYSNVVWVYAFTTITNAKYKSGYVSWRSYTETNLDYYMINDTKVSKGKILYSIKVPTAPKYYIIAHYNNGDTSVLKTL